MTQSDTASSICDDDERDVMAERTAQYITTHGGETNNNDIVGFYQSEDFDDEQYAALQRSLKNTRKYKSRTWCFTWNNYDTINHHRMLMATRPLYIVYGYEIGPETGTPHLQGFIVFESDRTFGVRSKAGNWSAGSLKALLPEVYFKVMYSNSEACIKYCKKGDNFVELGEPPKGKGHRSDMDKVFDAFDQGLTLNEVRVHPETSKALVMYPRGFQDYYHALHTHRDGRPQSFWCYGQTGTGKTKLAYNNHDKSEIYQKLDGGRFWNRYDYQPVVVIDEFQRDTQHKDGWSLRYLLQVLDCYPIYIEDKGTALPFAAQVIYISSQYPPSHYFPDPKELAQVLRRLTMSFNFYLSNNDEYEYSADVDNIESYYNEDKADLATPNPPLVKDFADKMRSIGRRPLMSSAHREIVARVAANQLPSKAAATRNKSGRILSHPQSQLDPDG